MTRFPAPYFPWNQQLPRLPISNHMIATGAKTKQKMVAICGMVKNQAALYLANISLYLTMLSDGAHPGGTSVARWMASSGCTFTKTHGWPGST